MKKMTTIVAGLMLWLGAAQPVTAWAEMLIPVGQVVGLEIGDDSVIVAAYDEALGNAARDAGLLIGDEILRRMSARHCSGPTVMCLSWWSVMAGSGPAPSRHPSPGTVPGWACTCAAASRASER